MATYLQVSPPASVMSASPYSVLPPHRRKRHHGHERPSAVRAAAELGHDRDPPRRRSARLDPSGFANRKAAGARGFQAPAVPRGGGVARTLPSDRWVPGELPD
ncbi:hypothetical protein TOPH_01049 [Tolypocladium ophioglossoides CBS 100239]|uniref:Uncharacterized protein n=1 Tax=Tolypocladium ophioglossoides (strain CBS 100239) TaxID=1163406 RepID=A0A0L0NKM2_TOLOC|nr:hypothetical protein TOPH_01049 [Tolypocladium ophioglossoides CBS 100239]